MALFRSVSKISKLFNSGRELVQRLSSSKAALQARPADVDAGEIEKTTKEVIETCNNLVAQQSSRNFAIIHLLGKQWRVTDGDLLLVEGFWPPNIGDRLRLDKVLLAGTKDVSLIGRPLVQPGLVNVTATVISKGISPTKTHFKKKPKKQYMRINFHRNEQTILRINSVEIGSHLNKPQNVF